ncbi:MAG: ParB/RepB/Spo0J family partition protein [Alphaproteobacteria bacterium]
MTEEAKRRGLGRGLASLLGEETEDYASLDRVRQGKTVPLDLLRPGRHQPRHRFDEAAIEALAQSIREQGILQPILVRRTDDADRYEIIAGERRWRAAQIAGLHEVPVLVRNLTDSDALEIALVENVQRQDLTPLEEAEGYQRLIDEFAHTQEDLSKVVGKSRSHIANTLRLLNLPSKVKEMLENGELSAGHGRALLNAVNMESLAKEVARKGLNVRQTEALVRRQQKGEKAKPSPITKDADTLAIERNLSALLGLRVTVRFHGKKGGELIVHYKTLEQLDDVLRRLSHPSETHTLKE